VKEIRYAYQPSKEAQEIWKIDPVISNISVGWLSAAYDEPNDRIGICWYDTVNKTLWYRQRTVSGPWEPAERVETNQNDVGSNCSLAFGSGVMTGPGIAYYNTTAQQLSFAWKANSGVWQNTRVDGSGVGRESSLSYTKEGYPCIAYRHEGINRLRLAYLNTKTDSEASFDSDVTTGPVPLTVRFFDRTVNNTVTSLRASSDDDLEIEVDCHYWWDLNGDGTWDVQDIWNPAYTYVQSGTYDVKLMLHVVIYNIYETRTDVVDFWGVADYADYINATGPSPVSADFTATPVSGTPPLEVTFTDTSGGTPASWYWTFGDGTSSREQNPVHTYQGIGRYTVSLETDGPAGGGAVRKPAFIDVNGGPLKGQSGMLQVHSEPSGADIYVDGILQGQTPVDTLVVKTGTHSLRVHRDGYRDWTRTILVPAGEVKIIPTVKLRLE
jgi:PKD repeat protein